MYGNGTALRSLCEDGLWVTLNRYSFLFDDYTLPLSTRLLLDTHKIVVNTLRVCIHQVQLLRVNTKGRFTVWSLFLANESSHCLVPVRGKLQSDVTNQRSDYIAQTSKCFVQNVQNVQHVPPPCCHQHIASI